MAACTAALDLQGFEKMWVRVRVSRWVRTTGALRTACYEDRARLHGACGYGGMV